MAEEKKQLGPNVTYLNSDGSAESVTVNGVAFKEGESVDVVKALGGSKEAAQAFLQKLAKNPYFQVDGGEKHDQSQYAEAKKAQKEKDQPPGQAKKNDEPPEDVATPKEATLERPDLPRGGRK